MAKFKKGGVTVDMFFDRQKMLNAWNRKEYKILSGTGAYYRKIVRNSMRPGGKKNAVSKPGKPPRYHTKLLRNGILFGYDKSSRSVVIGARKLNGSESAAEVLEKGGTTIVKTLSKNGKRKRRAVKIQARPYVGRASINYQFADAKFKELTASVPFK